MYKKLLLSDIIVIPELNTSVYRKLYKLSVETTIEHEQRVAGSFHVLQSLIFMILGHMGETHTDRMIVQFILLFDFDISA